MSNTDFITTYLPIIVATTTGLIGAGLGVYNFIQRQKDRKPKFEQFKRKKDTVGGWYIYVGAPSKPIRRCNATFKGQNLQLRNKKLGKVFGFHPTHLIILRRGKRPVSAICE